jgi:hypothetical protein
MPKFEIIALDREKDTGRNEVPKLNFPNSVESPDQGKDGPAASPSKGWQISGRVRLGPNFMINDSTLTVIVLEE